MGRYELKYRGRQCRVRASNKKGSKVHEKNIETLREEAQRLLMVEIALLEKMQDEEGVVTDAREGEQQTFDKASISKDIEVLKGELAKLENLEMVLAVVGTMKAGKSTTINAIVGTEVLPNRNRPMTALPTLIRHTPGQTEPVLQFSNSAPINDLMKTLQEVVKTPSAVQAQHLQSLDRNPDMVELLKLIGGKNFFKQTYQGADAIFWFLKSLNDLVRLSGELEVPFPFTSYDEVHEMPVIEVEFTYLRELGQVSGRLTLLDTPGPNESGQEHLREMLKEQLSKASAVLAVLDFSQLKSDADAEVRKDLEDIAGVAKGRLFALVNKFDQKDRYGDSAEQTQAFVAEDLMPGLIQKDDVFPVSSRLAYLANRAKHEMLLNKQLPVAADRSAWVADFADLAFGASWDEEDLQDDAGVRRAAEKLWKKSLFNEPMEKVIRSAFAGSAAFAIDSAAAKLIDNAERMGSFLGLRETALKKSSSEIKSQIDLLMRDIDRIDLSEKATKKSVEDTLAEVNKRVSALFENIKGHALEELDTYFKEGKRIERNQATQRAEEKVQKRKPGRRSSRDIASEARLQATTASTLATDLPSTTKRTRKRIPDEHVEADFDPKDPVMKFDNADDANNLMRRIQESVGGEMKDAEDLIHNAMSDLLIQFQGDFSIRVKDAAQDIVDGLKKRMSEDGFAVEVKIPDVSLLTLEFSAAKMLGDIVAEKTNVVIRHRRKSGLYGTVCRWFGTDDWGWETYKNSEQIFEIDMNKVRDAVLKGIENTFKGMDESVGHYIERPLQKHVTEFFSDFKMRVEHIRADLIQSVRDQEQSWSEKLALGERLAALKKKVSPIVNDSNELKSDVKHLLPPSRGTVL